jgi:hypothetical protein
MVEEIDRDAAIGLVEQLLGREEARRSGAKDGNVQCAGGTLQPGTSLTVSPRTVTETTSLEDRVVRSGARARSARGSGRSVTDQHTRLQAAARQAHGVTTERSGCIS